MIIVDAQGHIKSDSIEQFFPNFTRIGSRGHRDCDSLAVS